MCGIFGFYGKPLTSAQFGAMGQAIVHRGPDDSGMRHLGNKGLGNQRLSIIDIEGGHQPFVSDDGQITVVQNGEIYNYRELKQTLVCKTQSDTEVILRLYEKHGIDFINKLNGMFAIAIYDARRDALYLIRDRIGIKPLYVHEQSGQMCFGSEIKAILAAGIHPEIDTVALESYLSFNYVVPPKTMYKNIRHVLPGTWECFSPKGHQVHGYWSLDNIKVVQQSEQAWMAQFNAVLDDAVRIRMRADVPFGAFLSGGVDSSSVVGYMAKHSSQPVKTYCIGFHEPEYDESPYSEIAAKRFGTEHHCEKVEANMLSLWEQFIYHCDQPHGDVSFMPTYRVSELASHDVKMVLTGDGADELFAGYSKFLNLTDQHQYFERLLLFTDAQKAELLGNPLQYDAYGEYQQQLTKVAHMDEINQLLALDVAWLLPGNNLVKPDRMGMAVSLEARTPFLDYRMVELAFSMPGNLKLKNNTTKYIYKKAVKDLIGEDLAFRKKQMFTVPVGEWFKQSLRPWVEETLLSPKSKITSTFNAAVIKKMIAQHCTNQENYTRQIRALISLEMWLQTCVSKDQIKTASCI